MIVRIFIAIFASVVGGMSYIAGLGRLMTAFLLGFGAVCSLLLGILFVLPANAERSFLPVYEKVPAWPYFIIGITLLAMVVILFFGKNRSVPSEPVSATHFKYLIGAILGYLISLFLSSIYWFPSDAERKAADISRLTNEVLFGTCLFLVGITLSCFLFHRASKGCSERHPDMMRRFVLGIFSLLHLDKMPLLVAYLLIYSPETGVVFPHAAALALASYIPVGLFLLITTKEAQNF